MNNIGPSIVMCVYQQINKDIMLTAIMAMALILTMAADTVPVTPQVVESEAPQSVVPQDSRKAQSATPVVPQNDMNALQWTQIPTDQQLQREPQGFQTAPMFPGPGPMEMPQLSWAVSPENFQALVTAINGQTFASNQLPMIQTAGLCGWFTCSQCAALMGIFDFDDNRMAVVRYLAPHIINPIQCRPIMDMLNFESDRNQAWRILSSARL